MAHDRMPSAGDRGHDAPTRRRLGAWDTPEALVEAVVAASVPAGQRPGSRVRVLDPACGDGRFLAEAARHLGGLGVEADLTGVDVDPRAVGAARRALPDARILLDDALARDWAGERFDLVVGNPPFLNQLSAATRRRGRSSHGGGTYADAAAEFLALAVRLARPDGGSVGMVLPLSVLGARDAGPIRAEVERRGALRWLWWSAEPVFPDAEVRTCALVVELGARATTIRRAVGPGYVSQPDLPWVGGQGGWSRLLAEGLGVPELVPGLVSSGVLGDRATATADFRDQFYGLVGAVDDEVEGPPLVTSGLIDAGVCRWGERPMRFAGVRYRAPRVDLARLAPAMRRWAGARLVPKVLVASQTRVIESVVDAAGAWLPSVPVVTVVPRAPDDLWPVAAVLTSPIASAWVAHRSAGTGLSAHAVRVSAPALGGVPWPSGSLDAATRALRAGDVERCGREVVRAYGLDPDGDGAALCAWWGPLAVR